ncbi:MAG: hypothetical protein ABIG67_00420, partial [Pseudomonadota bacterium]
RFFTHCPILIQRAELRFGFNPDANLSGQYMRNHFDFPLNFQPVEGDRMILPGISVIKTPGHTPGHQSLLVKLASGRYYIFPGDALPLEENLIQKIPASNNWNNEQAMDSIYRLEHLSQLLGAEIIHSHDLKKWDTLKKTPNSYQ